MENKIRELRIKRDLTIYELADRCGLDHNTIAFLEQGRLDIMNTKFSTLSKLTNALNCTIYALFGVRNGRELKALLKVNNKNNYCDNK